MTILDYDQVEIVTC